MNKYEKIYKNLKKKYSDEEIAESMLIPEDLTVEEKKKAEEQLRDFRFKLLNKRTAEQQIYSGLLGLKFQMEDYIEKGEYDEQNSFGKYLEEYVHILKKTKKRLSEELDIHYTRLSRIINGREEPNISLTYRLEKHSGTLIPAIIWWKLMIKKQEYIIKKDSKTRKKESAKVKSAVKVRA